MRFRTCALFLISMLCSGVAAAAVQVNLSKDVELLAVNGEAIGLRLIKKNTLKLDDGLNQCVVRISKLVRQMNGEFEKFNSDPVIITFKAQDQSIHLSPKEDISTSVDAEAFNQYPHFIIQSSVSGLKVEQELLPRGPGITRDYEKEIIRFNSQRNISLKKQSIESQFSEQQHSKNDIMPISEFSDGSHTLKEQFLTLSEEERKAFLSWAVSQ
ncbi:YccT family protein [Vibrio cincinnatiensis]|uniref:YccT family protein n=1 Tax=Vibrio cincinnatiensis TaxID=675 RepID=UPI001FAA0CED